MSAVEFERQIQLTHLRTCVAAGANFVIPNPR